MTATAEPMTPFKRLSALLRALFQLDQPDLDFGLYRIINQRRDEISRFLDHDLLPRIEATLGTYQTADRADLERQIAELEKTLRDAGVPFSSSTRHQELQAELVAAPDTAALQNDIFSALITFFSRYYKDGDFISLRRYKPGVYAIPYEGEEVKLHWATADQYYVKTTEQFQDYRFRLPDGRHVHFHLVAASTEQNNNKPAEGKERRFAPLAEDFAAEVDGELVLRFAYRPDPEKQAKLNEAAVAAILADPVVRPWRDDLCVPATSNTSRPTLLEKRLAAYTARNTFDFFIHKDLGAFLRRELDFFLKTEILHLDDLAALDDARAPLALAKLRVIKEIGGTIIAFLAQIEDFQKRLFLKKKFVVVADYCLTLDHIPAELYPAIVANDAQWEEWERLFAISAIAGGVVRDVAWLGANQDLVLDTHFFDQEFKDALLASIEGLDEKMSGVIINADNFQALNLLQERYRGQARVIYIDPPYNIGTGDFLYKDNYQHSSWLSMLGDRLTLGKALGTEDSTITVSIDDAELPRVIELLDRHYGDDSKLATLAWDRNRKNDAKFFSVGHEYGDC